MFDKSQSGLIDISTRDVPSRRKTGLEQHQGLLGIGDDAVFVANYEVA